MESADEVVCAFVLWSFVEQDGVDGLAEFVFGECSLGDLRLSGHRDEEECGDGAYAEGCGELLLGFGVDLVDVDAVGVFGGELVEDRSEHLARSAP